MKAYVIGQPISHSLSPAMFRIISEVEASSLTYTSVEVAPEDLTEFFVGLRSNEDFVGMNVTIPHKEEILKLADEVAPEAEAIGAANVVLAGPKKLKAFNTDVIGIRKTLEEKSFQAPGKTALILGAGGSARAVAYVLGQTGARKVYVLNARSTRGDELAQSIQVHFANTEFKSIRDLSALEIEKIDLVVNCTPVGMKGEASDFFDLLKSLKFVKGALAFDLLYTPKNLLFLNIARNLGLETVDGLGMLIEQALATWELWIGKLQHPDELRKKLKLTLSAILKARENAKPIFLTGFMGVGKTTIARELSYSLNRTFIDTDRLIEEDAKATVSEIFASQGEANFRALERSAIEKAALSKNCVVALGGGALKDEANLEAVLKQGTLIYLRASENTLFRRLKKKAHSRPLLAHLNEDEMKHKITEMLRERAPAYERAQMKIDVHADDTPYDSAQAVLNAMGSTR